MATCPPGPFPANSWTVWTGPVPSTLTAFAIADLRTEAQHPYGYKWTTSYDGQSVMAIKQHHTWTYSGGKLVQGICIPGITLYRMKKVGISEVETDLSVPSQDVAWFDNGPPVDWQIVVGSGFALTGVIILFVIAMRRIKK